MDIFIVGEDEVTRNIIQRLVYYCSENYNILTSFPARGGRIKSLVQNYNTLSAENPVVLLTDIDTYDCAPSLINQWFSTVPKNDNFLVRVAIDEAEAWLMADREGFADYFKVPIDKIPTSKVLSRFRPSVKEMDFPYKSSLFMMRQIIPFTSKNDFKISLIPEDGISKGPLYNSSIVPFIGRWDIENAILNSTSLERTVNRLRTFAYIPTLPKTIN